MAAEINGIINSMIEISVVTQDAFTVLRDVFRADRALLVEMGRWEIQSQVFEEWRSSWRGDSRTDDIKWKNYAKEHPSAARRILKALATLCQVMTDATALERRYGFNKTDRPRQVEEDVSLFRFDDLSYDVMEAFRSRARSNLLYIQRCQFIIRKKEPRLDVLLNIVKDCNLTLRDNSPGIQAGRILRSDFDPLRNMNESELERIAEGAAAEAKHTDESGESERYRNLGLAASFLLVMKYRQAKPVYQFTMRDVHIDASYELGKHESMALLFDYPIKGERRVVLIEWVKLGSNRSERRKEIHDLALELAASKPHTMLVASCYGVLEDPSSGRIGLVLAPPSHIRAGLPRVMPPGSISHQRMPISLRDLIVRKYAGQGNVLELGMRFRLAQRLVDAAHVMHSTDWIHKNIRLDSVIFFPSRERSNTGVWGPSQRHPQTFDLNMPILVGFNHRPSRMVSVASSVSPRPEFSSNFAYNRTSYTLQLVKNKAPSSPHEIDFYRHPDRILDPTGPYNSHHDLYSVGVCLLEIG